MADGVVGDDDETFGIPLPPEDRLWRHPSELAPAAEVHRSGPWSTAVVSAAGGAFLVGALWLALGSDSGTRETTARSGAPEPAESVTGDQWTGEVRSLARPGTAVVEGTDGGTVAVAVAVRDDGVFVTSGGAVGAVGADLVLVDHERAHHEAEIVGHDPATDLSVLRIEASATPVLVPLQPELDPGDPIAVVDPTGAVAELAVAEEAAAVTTADGEVLVGVVVLDGPRGDAPPGSPAIDDTGAVVGVTTATAADDPAAVVPIDVASDVAGSLVDTGEVDHPRLGIAAVDLQAAATTEIGATGGDAPRHGALVTAVEPDGPAASGGVLVDDVVIAVDAVPVDSLAAMMLELRRHDPGDRVEVLVARRGQTVSCLVELGVTDPDGSAR